jgi:EAL domain-containing protein (putative c-di-GMP-specific phosphodiesterase class I)
MLLSRADLALYRAKGEGRGIYRFFTESMDTDVRTRVSLGHDLRNAIGSPQIFLVYQPQVDAGTGRIVGVEALARWRHPELGLISPVEFIPAAETNGLIVALGRWVLWEACRQAGLWRKAGFAPGVMAVNLSVLQFKTPFELEKDVAVALAASGLPPGMLELEITESLLMATSFANNEVLVRLRASGVRLAIDDFGTGFSSLDYLRQFPMDRIKIAQNFVLELGTAASTAAGSAAVVKATIGLARELGIDVIAEGVETAEQLRLIRSWRCDEVQGYFFAKPLSPDELVPLLQAGRIVPSAPVELKPAA